MNQFETPFLSRDPLVEQKNRHEKYEVKILKAPDVFRRTEQAMTTTGSVLGIKCADGVIIASDIAGFFGSLVRFSELKHIVKVNDQVIMGINGDYADFQYIKELVDQKVINDDCVADGFVMKGHMLYTWLTRVLYNRRSRFNPLLTNIVVAGYNDNTPFLGTVDKIGMSFSDRCIATGLACYLALPVLREAKPDISVAEAKQLLAHCFEILVYRDTRVSLQYQYGAVTAAGVEISEPINCCSNWEVAAKIRGYE